MDAMMGALWYRRETSAALKAMGFGEIRYWFDWHEVMSRAEKPRVNPPPETT
jgi:hypothetical protein